MSGHNKTSRLAHLNEVSTSSEQRRRKTISSDLKETIVTAQQSGKGYKVISRQSEVHQSFVRKIIQKWKIFTTTNLHRSGCSRKFTPMSGCAKNTFSLKRKQQQNLLGKLHRKQTTGLLEFPKWKCLTIMDSTCSVFNVFIC